MSWNIISNSSILRANSFDYEKVKTDLPPMPKGQENFAPQLLEYMNDVFTALDCAQTGYITIGDLEKFWKLNENGYDMFLISHYGISSASVVQCLQKITPENGMFSFRKFIRGMKMAVSNAKNDRLRNLCKENSRPLERPKTLWKPVDATKPLYPDVKQDCKLFTNSVRGTNGEKRQGCPQASRRPLQEKQFQFGQPIDEESSIESNDTSLLLNRSRSESLGLRKSAFCEYRSFQGASLELDSFISQSDTIDYMQGVSNKSDSSESKKGKGRTAGKVTKIEQSAAKEVPRRYGDPKYRAFRKTDLDSLVDQASEKIRMMQRCMDATENARDWYTKMISGLQQDRMELRRLVFLGKSREETEAKVNKMKKNWGELRYDDVKRNMSMVSYYNEQLQNMGKEKSKKTDELTTGDLIKVKVDSMSPLRPTTKLILEKLVEGQSRQIKQLENEKAALVREVFLMKGKLDFVEKPIDQVVPF